MELKDFLILSYRSPVFAGILIPILFYLYSIIINENWLTLIYSIPPLIWQILTLIFVVWIITISIRRHMSYYSLPFGFIPMGGWEDIGTYQYDGVIWRLRIPMERPFGNKEPHINIDPHPRCPKCETKLENIDKYYWYSWKCVRCNFKKRTWNTFRKDAERVEKLVEREIEIEKEKNATKKR